MALRNQPYIPLYVQDIMTDEKLNECSASTHGIYIKGIMCLMHKSENYGTILLKQKYKQSPKQSVNFASQLTKHLPYSEIEIASAIDELIEEKVCYYDGEYLCQKRMIKDNDLSIKRANSGKKGGIKTGTKFALAKLKAKTEDETEDETKTEDVIIIKDEIPNLMEFMDYGNQLCLKTNRNFHSLKFSIESKYNTWKDDGWKTGHDKPIKNWKNTLSNTFPHLKPINNNGKESRRDRHVNN